jgi:hypothetical protein
MPSPAATYAAITRGVERLINEHAENDRTQAAYQVAQAAIMLVRVESGDEAAQDIVNRLTDELVVFGETRP